MKKVISTIKAPEAIGPYNQAVEANGMVFISGQIPLNAGTMEIVGNNIADQTSQVLANMLAILEEAGLGFENVIKTTCYLKNMNDFQEMNNVYAKYFVKNQPSRATVEVARLPKDVLVEIEAIAAR